MIGSETGRRLQRYRDFTRLEENGFENFYNDMGDCPKGKYSVDRIDNSKGYFPIIVGGLVKRSKPK